MQLQEYRYRVAFDASLDTVAYTFHYFQAWDPAGSCPGCSLADMHAGVNRRAPRCPGKAAGWTHARLMTAHERSELHARTVRIIA